MSDKVREALAEATGDDAEDFTEALHHSGLRGATSYEGPGRSEYLVFEDYDAAEAAAVDYVKDMLEEDASMFTQSWLSNFIKIYPTDARIIAAEEADSYYADMADWDVLEAAGIQDEADDLEADRDAAETRLEEISDIEDAAIDNDKPLSERREAELDYEKEKLDAISDSYDNDYETLVTNARDDLAYDMADETEKYILRDPLGWWEGLGLGGNLSDQNFASLDYDAASQDAVDTDGMAHFLAHYDRNQLDLDNGMVAFRQN